MKQILQWSDKLDCISGIGPKKMELFEKYNLRKIGDLLEHYPKDYIFHQTPKLINEAENDTLGDFYLKIFSKPSVVTANHKKLTIFQAQDQNGTKIKLFYFNSNYIAQQLKTNQSYFFFGKLYKKNNQNYLFNPRIIAHHNLFIDGFIEPLYSLPKGISSVGFQSLVCKTIQDTTIDDDIPKELLVAKHFYSKKECLTILHNPKNGEKLKKAKNQLQYLEFFNYSLVLKYYQNTVNLPNTHIIDTIDIEKIKAFIPFSLTNSQNEVVKDIYRDMQSPAAMNRILIGDVGSGKTICAFISALLCIMSGYQVAIMAPTEILAEQHYNDFIKMFPKIASNVGILLGSTTAKNKSILYKKVSEGEISLIVGTHALLNDQLQFQNLGLIITDEQHKFGVVQRAHLAKKGNNCHVLVMSATPIPRTFALALYGNISISTITEMPQGRKPIKTYLVPESYLERISIFIEKEINNGSQAYIICPAIEEQNELEEFNDPDQIKSPLFTVNSAKNMLSNGVLSQEKAEILHGKLKAAQKESIIDSFLQNETKILISTTVVEVGINVPNATVMVILNAERFGLAQLHQLRGRIGRGSKQSYCILVSNSESQNSLERLNTLCKEHDGFKIAESDLKQRGPGDFFSMNSDSIRQSGGMLFPLLTECQSLEIMTSAFHDADAITKGMERSKILESFPHLKKYDIDTTIMN